MFKRKFLELEAFKRLRSSSAKSQLNIPYNSLLTILYFLSCNTLIHNTWLDGTDTVNNNHITNIIQVKIVREVLHVL